ncbi:hypothetical protein DS745_03480 [Anaerobacillus alkaliphilus]|uniref:Uncharacterized protein n=1 Tax=Anaerobacillus alkaliphilus TaxID=1548597 RepID=A0A4Q0VZL6_9BACI|nr:hypothetical protein [Anaerobacillus alkaliphilus]RXJ04458.1 hypothetical protein DS745_03480 [Anaerobacillus alkaliphilus]
MIKLKFLSILLLVFILSPSITTAEETNLLTSSMTYKGENQNWSVEHKIYLVGTEVEYETKIRYKGNDNELKNIIPLRYTIGDKDGVISGNFSLKDGNVYHSERVECGGCRYKENLKETTFIIGEWLDYEERLILSRE